MTRKIAPSERKAQGIAQWLHGQREGSDGQELVSALVGLSSERGLQEALEHEQAEALGQTGTSAARPCGGSANPLAQSYGRPWAARVMSSRRRSWRCTPAGVPALY